MQEQTDLAPIADRRLLQALTELAIEAAGVVMAIKHEALAVRRKPDESPVTAADEAAEATILAGLARMLPAVPAVSEERAAPAVGLDSVFILVDPLDGTREFIAGRAEFTVNIAVVISGIPVAGVVAAPALGLLWRGARDQGAERLGFEAGNIGEPTAITTRRWPAANPIALVSRSHLDADSIAWLGRLPGIVRQPCGSSLKFCRLAEGAADIYPRLAPTCEWDVAAGHALLAAAGGTVLTRDGQSLRYGNAAGAFRLPAFVACGDAARATDLLAPP